MSAYLCLVALGLALVDAYSPGGASLGVRSLRSRRTATVTNDLSILGAEDAESACVMLPQCASQGQTQHWQPCPSTRYSPGRASTSRSTPFDGSAPSLVCGEVNLQVS